MTELPLVKLPHFVTVEDLSSEQVFVIDSTVLNFTKMVVKRQS